MYYTECMHSDQNMSFRSIINSFLLEVLLMMEWKKALLTIWTLWRLSCWHWCYCYYMLFRVYSFFARHHHHDHQIIITIPWWLIIKSLFDSGRGRERPKERKILQWTNYNGGESSKSSKRGSHNITSSYLAHLKLSILFCAFFLFFLKSEDCL